jgi:hypothetical protein
MDKKLWFKAKHFGYGWYPISWQGWVVTLLYIIALLSFTLSADQSSHSVSDTLISFAGPYIVLTCLLLAVCYKKGEKPEWRWNLKRKD